MQIQTLYSCSPDDIEAAMIRVVAPLVERIRTLEMATGSAKHLYTTREAGQRIGYSAEIIRRFIREGTTDRKGKRVYLKFKELTNGDYRIRPVDLDAFLAHF